MGSIPVVIRSSGVSWTDQINYFPSLNYWICGQTFRFLRKTFKAAVFVTSGSLERDWALESAYERDLFACCGYVYLILGDWFFLLSSCGMSLWSRRSRYWFGDWSLPREYFLLLASDHAADLPISKGTETGLYGHETRPVLLRSRYRVRQGMKQKHWFENPVKPFKAHFCLLKPWVSSPALPIIPWHLFSDLSS